MNDFKTNVTARVQQNRTIKRQRFTENNNNNKKQQQQQNSTLLKGHSKDVGGISKKTPLSKASNTPLAVIVSVRNKFQRRR